jgi:hypothetical protein
MFGELINWFLIIFCVNFLALSGMRYFKEESALDWVLLVAVFGVGYLTLGSNGFGSMFV